jgi:putative ABC transport system permease protein
MTALAIAISVALFSGVNKVRSATRDAFSGAISKVDLIVGPRSGSLSLLLYSVFHVGTPSHLISMESMQLVSKMDGVDWVVPFNLGDGFKGYAVVGTTPELFNRYKFGFGESTRFATGQSFSTDHDVVLGYEVSGTLGLKIGDKIVLSHGHTEDGDGFEQHENHPFTVVGILSPSGTPLDKSVFVSMAGLHAIHEGIQADHSKGDHSKKDLDDDHAHESHGHGDSDDEHHELASQKISGFFLGTKERSRALSLQREINNLKSDALLAIMPGLTLSELWKNLSIFETSLSVISLSVVISGLLGLFVSLYILSGQRRQEMMVLRAVGGGPFAILGLLAGESVFLVLLGIIAGYGFMAGSLAVLAPWIEKRFSVVMRFSMLSKEDLYFCGAMLIVGCIAGIISSIGAYRSAMKDGLGSRF